MATRVHELAATVADEYGGDASRLWTRGARRRRAARAHRRAARLRRDEDQERSARCSRSGSASPVAQALVPEPSDARRRRLAAGARRLPGREARLQGGAAREGVLIELRTLTDGGQPAEQTAHALADFVARRAAHARDRDLRLPSPRRPRRRSSRARSPARPSAASPSGSPTTSTTPRSDAGPAAAAHEAGARRGAAVPDRRRSPACPT